MVTVLIDGYGEINYVFSRSGGVANLNVLLISCHRSLALSFRVLSSFVVLRIAIVSPSPIPSFWSLSHRMSFCPSSLVIGFDMIFGVVDHTGVIVIFP